MLKVTSAIHQRMLGKKQGTDTFYLGDILPADVPKREIYIYGKTVAKILHKDPNVFRDELKHGIYDGIRFINVNLGHIYNMYDVFRFAYPFISEDKIGEFIRDFLEGNKFVLYYF